MERETSSQKSTVHGFVYILVFLQYLNKVSISWILKMYTGNMKITRLLLSNVLHYVFNVIYLIYSLVITLTPRFSKQFKISKSGCRPQEEASTSTVSTVRSSSGEKKVGYSRVRSFYRHTVFPSGELEVKLIQADYRREPKLSPATFQAHREYLIRKRTFGTTHVRRTKTTKHFAL